MWSKATAAPRVIERRRCTCFRLAGATKRGTLARRGPDCYWGFVSHRRNSQPPHVRTPRLEQAGPPRTIFHAKMVPGTGERAGCYEIRRGKPMRPLVHTIALLCLIATAPRDAAQQPTAIPVGVLPAELRPITQATDFVGRVEAMERVDIRARVTGFLQEVLFKEGDLVKEGDVLYRIEPDTFQAAVQQAQGALLEAQGKFANATAQRARTEELVKTDAASARLLDARIADEKSAQGDVITADANLKTANVNLGYTEITAPITGEIGRTKLTKGNVVGPDSGVLTTIVSRDPMYVTFPVSQREFLNVQSRRNARRGEQALAVRIRFSDGSTYDQTGRINFVDVTVDRATDTVMVRATMPNPQWHADRRAARPRLGRSRQAGREGAGAAVGADRRSAGDVCLHRGGWQGAVTAREAGRRIGPLRDHRRRPQGRRAGGRAGDGKPAPRLAGDRQSGAAAA